MKIAIIASGFLPVIDGVTVTGFYRLQQLSSLGHQVILFCPDYSKIDHIYPNWAEYTGNILPNVRVINLPSTPFFVEFERNVAWYSHSKLVKELENFQPDIIHVDEPERIFVGFWRVAGIQYARQHQIPCVCFFRTNFLEYLEDFFPLPKPILSCLQWLVTKLILYVYNSYDLTLVTSPITQQKIKQRGINNTLYGNLLGLEQDKFNLELRQPNFFASHYQLPQLDAQVKIVFLGRLTPDKGWYFTLNNLEKLFKHIDPEKIAFLIVGDGEMKPTIAKELSKFTKNFYLFGRVSQKNIPALLINSDLHVTTSEKETRGLTILEAFAASIPVLAPNAGGVVENIESGINGFLYEPGNSNDFVEKLKLLVEDSNLRYQMGLKARDSIQNKYSWEQTVKNLVNIWEEVIEKQSIN